MFEYFEESIGKLRYLAVGLLMLVAISFLPFLVSAMFINPSAQAAETSFDIGSAGSTETPNAITRGVATMAGRIGKSTDSLERTVSLNMQSATKSVVATFANTGHLTARAGGGVAAAVTDTAGSGVNLVTHSTGDMFDAVTNKGVIGALIKPGDRTAAPVIDTQPISREPAPPRASAAAPLQAKTDTAAAWPIHGSITTEFGVPEWPYSPIHTGIDISDGQRAGLTPVHPFKLGTVVEVIRSSGGLGNHVVIDHGGGITSVYGHLASISANVGQKVNQTTSIGYEGSTGVSTGPHVHFEVRLNGQPVNPHKFIVGLP